MTWKKMDLVYYYTKVNVKIVYYSIGFNELGLEFGGKLAKVGAGCC